MFSGELTGRSICILKMQIFWNVVYKKITGITDKQIPLSPLSILLKVHNNRRNVCHQLNTSVFFKNNELRGKLSYQFEVSNNLANVTDSIYLHTTYMLCSQEENQYTFITLGK